MRFTPVYNVMYHGEVHRAGQPFEIDPADAAEMAADWAGKEPDEPAAAFSLIGPEEAVAVPGSELKPEPEAEGLAAAGALSRERVAAADFEDVARVDNLAAWPEKQSEAAQFGGGGGGKSWEC